MGRNPVGPGPAAMTAATGRCPVEPPKISECWILQGDLGWLGDCREPRRGFVGQAPAGGEGVQMHFPAVRRSKIALVPPLAKPA